MSKTITQFSHAPLVPSLAQEPERSFIAWQEVKQTLAHRSARLVFRLLDNLQHGSLHIVLPDGSLTRCGHSEPQATLHLHNWQVCEAVLKRGDIGFAESYMAGDWHSDDLARLLDVLILNRQALDKAVYGSWWGSLYYRLKHWLQGNTRQQARKNIQAHYDLGNAFYQLWLDPSMTYSSALNLADAPSLEAAQQAKYQRILNELQLSDHAKVLEVGCGWGGFAELATAQGATVVGLTLSTEQQHYAQQRLARLGRAEQAEFRLQDYRDTQGQFDGIASIEMFEAVGEEYWATYFAAIARNLKSGGRAVIQTITIADALFERYRRSTDFIQQYIFPGGMLPSPSRFCQEAELAGLRVVNQRAFGQDYAGTLRQWRHDFMGQLDAIRRQGFDDRFIRMWEFYLAYCESAFRQGNTDVYQYTLQKN
ncbi:SAM-dependent methyltransferase [Parvibium lacunae]|uniref:Class I SAM-dependent methyltransferase n=1 Tax=Parvibium lacunae TaxID=1888893 RepID=A0A368L133_9BURK|nr:cyclopropane-fatty-acyl-phospholipid synthase family protein [Parvibium lacunae]RCS57137.1 class I SAM-dependent methyltransferase [Parvibium lacunae]